MEVPIYQSRKDHISMFSLDGGGMRGLIPAIFLSEVEKRTELLFSQFSDLTCATSAGALVGAGLLCPGKQKRASEIVDLFIEKGPSIFPPTPWYMRPAAYVGWVVSKPWYSSEGMHNVLDELCGKVKLSETLSNIVIPAAQVANPCLFTNTRIICSNNPNIDNTPADQILLSDALKATTAAPTYLAPHKIIINGKLYNFMDGGLFANNPIDAGRSYARSYFDYKDILVGSFGTGRPPDKPSNSYFSQGLISIGINFAATAIELAAREAEQEAKLALSMNGKILRLQPNILEEDYELDDTSPQHIERVVADAHKCIEDNDEDIRDFCEALFNKHERENGGIVGRFVRGITSYFPGQ